MLIAEHEQDKQDSNPSFTCSAPVGTDYLDLGGKIDCVQLQVFNFPPAAGYDDDYVVQLFCQQMVLFDD